MNANYTFTVLLSIHLLINPLTSAFDKGSLFSSAAELSIFEYKQDALENSLTAGYVTEGSIIVLNRTALKKLFDAKPERILFKIPFSKSEFYVLELEKSRVIADDFKTALISSDGSISYAGYEPGLYYRGQIKGRQGEWAALSFFEDYAAGVIASAEGNFNLSPLYTNNKNPDNNGEYIFFNDSNLKNKNSFMCGSDDEKMSRTPFVSIIPLTAGDAFHQYPMKKYFECDYKMYQMLGSNQTNVNNFLTAAYNAVIALYQAEQVITVLQSTYIWTSPDIYTNTTDLFRILKRFGARVKNTFNGHTAHFLSMRTDIGGGIAWIDMLCWPYYSGDSSGPYAVSVIDTTVRTFPVYSYTVNNIAHETGHTAGSLHTHSCLWPGGPIDTCYTPEGGCYNGPLKPRQGTIMSYCHVNGGINFSLGFGPLPGNVIRARYQAAPCLIGIIQLSSSIPDKFILEQNYPNPFNPATKIKFSVPQTEDIINISVYDAKGSLVEVIVNLVLSPGTYAADFDASRLASGIYFCTLRAGAYSVTRKMVAVK